MQYGVKLKLASLSHRLKRVMSSIKILVFSVASCTVSVSSKNEKLKNMPEQKEGLHYLHDSTTLLKIVSVP